MRKLLLLLSLAVVGRAANPVITLIGATSTQIAVSVVYGGGGLTITMTDNGGGPSVHDVDATLFANSNVDTSRTTANNFRWHTIVNGTTRIVVLGGHDEVKLALDGKWYSTALQANTDHTITFTNGGDTATIHASTSSIPGGSAYPEMPIPAPTNPNPGYPIPTIDWASRTTKYIDPITGILLQRISAPLDLTYLSNTGQVFNFAYDVQSHWTNPNNALTNQQAGTLATTSTINAPLFLASNSAWLQNVTDEQAVLYGNSTAGTEVTTICWSEDSGQTCASGSIDSTAFTNGAAGVQASLPSAYPTNQFSAWGVWTKGTGQYDIGNASFGGVNASGSTVTMPTWTGSGFNTDRPNGSKFTLAGCLTGANITLTVNHVDSPTQITTVEGGLNHTACTYQDYGSGVRIVLKTAGTVNLSATYKNVIGSAADSGTNGSRDVCNIQKVTDIQTDCDHVAQSPALSGRLCQVRLQGKPAAIYLLQDNGRMCLQSVGKHGTIQHLYELDSPWITAKSYMGSDGTDVWSVTKLATDHDYTEYVPGVPPADDVWTYLNLSGSPATPIKTQIVSAGGVDGQAINTGLFDGGYNVNGLANGYVEASYNVSQETPAVRAMMDSSWHLVRTYDTWSQYPMRWGGAHSGLGVAGNFTNLLVNPLDNFNTGQLLGGPFVLPVIALRKNGVFQPYTLTVTGGTAGNPTTTLTIPNHDLAIRKGMATSGGAYIICAGGTGGWVGINANYFHATYVDDNTVTVPVSTSGAISGSITCQTAPPITTVTMGGITNTNPPVATINPTANGDYGAFVRDNRNLFQNGDPITFSALSTTAQFYACNNTSTTFTIYTDPGCTTPATFSSVSAANGSGLVAFAETCPATSAAALMPNGVLYFDSGNLSSGVPKVRCATMRVRSQPCSEFAGAGEKAAYPCPTNNSFSSLQNIAVGDVLYSLEESSGIVDHEHKLVLAVTVNAPASIDITFMRWYGDDPSWNVGGFPSPQATACCVNAPGWTPYAYYTMHSVWYDTTNPGGFGVPEPPPYAGVHHDVGEGGPAANLINLAGTPSNYNDLVNITLNQLTTTPVVTSHNNLMTWQGDTTDTMYGSTQQSYANHRQASAALLEQPWKADVTAINAESGTGGGAIDGAGISRTITKVGGFNYVYSISNPAPGGAAGANVKIVPYLMSGGVQQFSDISGSGNCTSSPNGPTCITDSTVGNYCIAYAANECNTGSTKGQTYFTSKIMWTGATDPGGCYSNNQTVFNPCLYPMWPNAGWLEQMQESPIDTNGSGTRRLATGWSMPLEHFAYYNWVATPDAKYGIFVANPLSGKIPRGNGYGTVAFLMKLLPWPMADSVNRMSLIQTPVNVLRNAPGDTVRVIFGNGENGIAAATPPCTTRGESCWTSAAPTTANPFQYSSETQSRIACDPSCTVNVPIIPNRVTYYQVEHLNGSLDAANVLVDTFSSTQPVISNTSIINSGKLVPGGKLVPH
jgi:hypothetical protein